jgi:hypothetical protein
VATSDSDQPAIFADDSGPLVLCGPPAKLRGQFRVQNPSSRSIVVRQPRLRASTGKHAVAAVLPHAEVALRRIVIRAGRPKPVNLSVALDGRTPPGTYHAELDVGGQLRDVVLHVSEEVSLRLEPSELVLPSRPGAEIHKRLVLVNEGNVAIAVGDIGRVALDDELAHCRALRGALADVGDKLQGLDDFVVALGRRYQAIYEPLVVDVHNDAVSVRPGDTVTLDLRLKLPEKIHPRARYTASAPISTSTLSFSLVPDQRGS